MRDSNYKNRYGSYNTWSSARNILRNMTYTGRLHYGEVIVENAHEAIIADEQFQAAQAEHAKRVEIYGNNAFQSKHLLAGMIFCGKCGARYYRRNSGTYQYYSCYSRTKQMKNMVKDPNCKNKHWKMAELETLIENRVRELLHSPELVAEIAESQQKKPTVVNQNNVSIEKRIREIDKQINKLMELYQQDGIPANLLGESINKLYNEKTALQAAIEPVEELTETPFDLVEALIADAAQVWDFADKAQKRRILQSLIRKITLTDDIVDIEWNF